MEATDGYTVEAWSFIGVSLFFLILIFLLLCGVMVYGSGSVKSIAHTGIYRRYRELSFVYSIIAIIIVIVCLSDNVFFRTVFDREKRFEILKLVFVFACAVRSYILCMRFDAFFYLRSLFKKPMSLQCNHTPIHIQTLTFFNGIFSITTAASSMAEFVRISDSTLVFGLILVGIVGMIDTYSVCIEYSLAIRIHEMVRTLKREDKKRFHVCKYIMFVLSFLLSLSLWVLIDYQLARKQILLEEDSLKESIYSEVNSVDHAIIGLLVIKCISNFFTMPSIVLYTMKRKM